MSWLDLARFQLEAPEALWGLLLIPLLALLRERSSAGLRPWRSFGALVLRCLALAALLLAIAQPVEEQRRVDRSLVFVVDASASLDEGRRAAAEAWLRDAWGRLGDLEARVVVAGARPAAVEDLDEAVALLADVAPATAGTDLRSALELGLASFPPARSKDAVLLSDGAATRGTVVDALRVASARDLPIHTVALGPAALQSSIVAATPQQDRILGEVVAVSVQLEANAAVEGTLILSHNDGEELARTPLSWGPGATQAELSWTPTEAGLHQVGLQLTVRGDAAPEDNTLAARLRVQEQPSALVVGGTAAAAALKDAVVGFTPPLRVEHTAKLPEPPYDAWSLLVLIDPDLPKLPLARTEALRDWVQGGGRLLVTGGEQGLVTDEPSAKPLAEILPVRFPKTKKQQRAPLSVVYALDRSDSMAGSAKFELAAAALAQSLHLLPEDARVGVIGFSDFSDWLVPLDRISSSDDVLAALQAVRIRGGTSIFHALQEALDVLRNDDALVKHVILLSDGQSTTTFQRHGDVVTGMLRQNITVTTIAVSPDSDRPEMERIAEAGGGRAHYTERFSDLPKLFLDEMMMVTRTNKVEEDFEVLPVRGSRYLAGLSVDAVVPRLGGYVRGEQRPGSELVLATADGHPILAAGRHGRGSAVLLTTDLGGPWSERWRSWKEHRGLWEGVLDAVLRPDPPERLSLSTGVEGRRATLLFDAVDPLRNPRGDLIVEALLDGPDGSTEAVPMPVVGPGRYGVEVPLQSGGATLARVAAIGTLQPNAPPAPGGELLASLHPTAPEEARASSFNPLLLRQIAEQTGGLVDPSPAQVLERDAPERVERIPRWPWPLALALIVLVLDLGWRRVRIPGLTGRR
jgi:Ca-activated chloride channel homolog